MTLSVFARRAVAGDEALLRELRLQALADSPAAFGSTYERELARQPEDWQRWISPGATFILEAAGQPRGIVAAVRDAESEGVVQLMAMWVHPEARGSGGPGGPGGSGGLGESGESDVPGGPGESGGPGRSAGPGRSGGPGAAAALVGAVVDWARNEGARVVQLQVVASNARARRCYEKHGFTPTGRTSIRERDGAIEWQMERPI